MTQEQWIETQTLSVGFVLPNGWTVVHATGDADHAVVLAYNAENEVTPYATWFARYDGDEWVTFWGTYHNEVRDANAAYEDRVGR